MYGNSTTAVLENDPTLFSKQLFLVAFRCTHNRTWYRHHDLKPERLFTSGSHSRSGGQFSLNFGSAQIWCFYHTAYHSYAHVRRTGINTAVLQLQWLWLRCRVLNK